MQRSWRWWLVAVAVLGCRGSDDMLTANGTVEIREINVAPTDVGRVTEMRVDEGDIVGQGDTLAVLSTPTLAADLDAAVARRATAAAHLRDLEAGERPEEIAAAEATLAAREAEAERTARDSERLQTLLAAGAVAARDADLASTAARVAAEEAARARHTLALARAGSRPEQITAARTELAAATAALAAQRAVTADYILRAPVDGVVLLRVAEPGDLLAPGGVALRLGQPRYPWVRVYVPARVLPLLALGDSARIYPPGAGGAAEGGGDGQSMTLADSGVAGRIVAISPQAEYVTRTALTESERADLLFGVKVAILDSTGVLKSGLPVTVTLRPGRPISD